MAKAPEDIALSRAKIQLMKKPNTIFYTTLLFSLKQVFTDQVETAATDGLCLYINPNLFLEWEEEVRVGVLLHEIMHPMLGHITRKGTRDHTLWNMAGDHVINLMLLSQGYKLPSWVLADARFTGMSTEQVYVILFDETEKERQAGGAGAKGMLVPGGSDIIEPKSKAEKVTVEKAIADMVIKASTIAKGANEAPGNASGEMNVMLQEVLNPKLPWSTIFQNYMSAFAKGDYSWQRPNRRYMPEHYLPSAYSEAICNIAIAVDSSGSVSDEEFTFFISEIKTIQETLFPEVINLIDFDSTINHIYTITQDTDIFEDIAFSGRGGTNVLPVMKWAIEANPEVLVVFTDGEFYMPSKEFLPDCPVIWVIHDNPGFTCSVGEVIHYEMEE